MQQLLLQFAQKIDAGKSGIPKTSANDLLTNSLDLVYFFAGAIAVIVIIVAGIMYSASSGDTGRIAKAKNLLTYAIAGLVVVLSAFAITHFIIGGLN